MTSSSCLRCAAVIAAAAFAIAVSIPFGASGAPVPPPSSYPSCGVFWHRMTQPSATQRRASACLQRAWREGGKARLVAVLTTIEGDPIVAYVFVNGRLPVLAIVDSTRDAFGPREWTRMRCGRITVDNGHLEYHECRSVGRGKPAWLTPIKLKA